MIKNLLCLGISLFLLTCQKLPEPSSRAYYISSFSNSGSRMPANDCTFRYRMENSFGKLSNQIQQLSLRAAFDLWQEASQNIVFIQRQDTQVTELKIRFVAHSEIKDDLQKSTIGIIRGDISTLSTARKENNAYTILLDTDFSWDGQAITRVMAYHIGIFLGMEVSKEKNSILNPFYVRETIRLSENDVLRVKALYPKACSVSCNNFLPMQLPILKAVTKSVRLDKQGTISINATGSMVVGFWLGYSTPVGLEKGIGNIPIGDYSIMRDFWHASLIYKINNETKWRKCGASCEFETDGVSQCVDITLGINDLDLSDNNGFYDVVVDYKK